MTRLPATTSPTLPIAEALERYARAAVGAFSPNTERAIRSDTAVFAEWCASVGASSLPAEPETVAGFIDAKAADKKPASIRRYVASIAALHRAAAVTDPTKAEIVRLALKRLHRAKGRRQGQALGLTLELRNRMLDAAGDRLVDLRNKALVAVAYDTACRRSELVAFRVRDLRAAEDGSGTVLVARSKTDQEGRGQMRYLAPDTMEHVRVWLAAACLEEGMLFRSVGKGGKAGGQLARSGADSGAEVARIFKTMAKAAGLKPSVVKAISGHSARVGAAQDMAAGGIDIGAIMQAGGWKTAEMVARYTERLSARRGAAAKLAAMQNRA